MYIGTYLTYTIPLYTPKIFPARKKKSSKKVWKVSRILPPPLDRDIHIGYNVSMENKEPTTFDELWDGFVDRVMSDYWKEMVSLQTSVENNNKE